MHHDMDRYKITIETWDKLATAYQDKFMDLNLYNDTYDAFCRLVTKPNARILEVGCGPGNITRYLLSKRPDFKIEATDVAPNMVRLAQENNPQATVSVLDCREIGNLKTTFDGIVCGFCMPYLAKEDGAKLIRDASGQLNEGGVFYCSAIEGEYSQSAYQTSSSGDNKLYVYYHPADFFLKELAKNNLDLVELIRKPYPKSDGSSDTHLILLAKKK